MHSRTRSLLGNLALAAGATVLTLLALEVALRLAGHRMVFPQMYVEDPYTVFRLKPGPTVRTINAGYFDYEYTVNRDGFRGTGPITPKSGARRRLLFVGDSFTFGVGVDDTLTYPARVGARLRQWCVAPIESINGGVGGFGTSHELSFLQHYGWRLQPDVVVLGFLTGDPEDNALRGLHRLVDDRLEDIPLTERPGWGLVRASKHVPGYDWLVRHSTLFNWARLKIGSVVAQRAAAREAAPGQTPASVGIRPEERELQRWVLTAAIFERIRAQADSHGVRLIVAIIPHSATLTAYYDSGRDVAVDRMLDICRTQKLACVNVAESIHQARPQETPGSLYLPEGHFNAAGYDLVAEVVARRLAEELGCSGTGS